MSRVTLPHTRFTVDEFVRLVEADAFGTTRVELLNGRMYFRTQREPHMTAMSNATEVFNRVRAPGELVIFQDTLRLDRLSAPDPMCCGCRCQKSRRRTSGRTRFC